MSSVLLVPWACFAEGSLLNRARIHRGPTHDVFDRQSAVWMECPLWVDAVDKVGDEQRTGNNRIPVPSYLNQYCAPDSKLKSMLLTRPSKNVYRQHRSRAAM